MAPSYTHLELGSRQHVCYRSSQLRSSTDASCIGNWQIRSCPSGNGEAVNNSSCPDGLHEIIP